MDEQLECLRCVSRICVFECLRCVSRICVFELLAMSRLCVHHVHTIHISIRLIVSFVLKLYNPFVSIVFNYIRHFVASVFNDIRHFLSDVFNYKAPIRHFVSFVFIFMACFWNIELIPLNQCLKTVFFLNYLIINFFFDIFYTRICTLDNCMLKNTILGRNLYFYTWG